MNVLREYFRSKETRLQGRRFVAPNFDLIRSMQNSQRPGLLNSLVLDSENKGLVPGSPELLKEKRFLWNEGATRSALPSSSSVLSHSTMTVCNENDEVKRKTRDGSDAVMPGRDLPGENKSLEESSWNSRLRTLSELPKQISFSNTLRNPIFLSGGLKTPSTKNKKSPMTSCSTVTEGRGQARGEVGIAGMDPHRPLVVLCQISDGQRYINTLSKMNVFSISEVIVPNTFVDKGNKLYSDIRSRFPDVVVTSVQRRHFSDTVGIDLIHRYSSPDSTSQMILIRDKFYALSAAAALIKYIEFTQNVNLAPGSLKIEYQGSNDAMLIDLDTANRLELVTCFNSPQTNAKSSLLGVLNRCHTNGGLRLLRANILQPYCCLQKIQMRLNSVTELINNEILLCGLEGSVRCFSHLESLLNLCMHAPQQDGIRVAEYQLKYTLLLKTTLEHLPKLIASLENAKTENFNQFLKTLRDPRYNAILKRILDTVCENVKTVKGSVAAHLHGCFAVKAGINSLLDIAKKTYCEIVQEITEHVAELREKHDLPLRMSFSANKGFHIQCSVPVVQRKNDNIPEEFILVQKSKTTMTFYTADLVALDQRSQHVLNEIKLMTNAILIEMLTDIRQHIGCLFNLCEIIAELDVIISLAHVSSGRNFVKPNFGGKLHLRKSRHPILDVTEMGNVVPNDVVAEPDKNFIILTGPNQSGKSVYIRQIALLQIMAQIGCFIPAEEASFKVVNQIFSRIGFDDSIECNASTLIAEMREMEYIKRNMSLDSLVIVDELCRGTSADEGTALAFAICEQLLDTSAFVFFTTHYLLLTRLEELYSTVINYHFEMTFQESESKKTLTCFPHTIQPGPESSGGYGIQVANLTSFPQDITSKANEMRAVLLGNRTECQKINGIIDIYKLSVMLKQELLKRMSPIDYRKIQPVARLFKKKYSSLGIRSSRTRSRMHGNSDESGLGEQNIYFIQTLDSKIEMNLKAKKGRRMSRVFYLAQRIKRKYKKLMQARRLMKSCI